MSNSDDRAEIIESARNLDAATFDSESCAVGPGRYQGTDDLSLVVALDIISGHGFADQTAGDTETTGHYARVGRFVLTTDSAGFVDSLTFESDGDAADYLDEIDEMFSDDDAASDQ